MYFYCRQEMNRNSLYTLCLTTHHSYFLYDNPMEISDAKFNRSTVVKDGACQIIL